MSDTPVTFIAGPRQSGKTTLARYLLQDDLRYYTLDDENILLTARNDPIGFIQDMDRAIIDEIQRAPNLLQAIKKTVDEDRRSGRFLLTGSANLMTLPTVSESLAGRMETLVLLPLSQAELEGSKDNWLDRTFQGNIPASSSARLGPDLLGTVIKGGYPEAFTKPNLRRRRTWFRQYIAALLQRDVREIAGIDKLGALPQYLNALAQVAGQVVNYTQLGGKIGISYNTAAKYITIFEQMFILRRVEPWFTNSLSRLTKSPKIQFLDSGILSHLVGLTQEIAHKDRTLFGKVLESFVYSELMKFTTWSDGDYRIFHFRERDRYEVDFIIENENREIIGVEVKAGATINPQDLRGLRRLSEQARERMIMGVILYDGDKSLPFGNNIHCAPISSLWAE
jgi:hypothetical protein